MSSPQTPNPQQTSPRPSRPRRRIQRTEAVSDNRDEDQLRNLRKNRTFSGKPSPPIVRRAPRRVVTFVSPSSVPQHHTLTPQRSNLKTRASKPMKRCVSFGESVISEVDKTPKDLKSQLWYDRSELTAMRSKAGQMVESGPQHDSSENCWRGLEKYAKDQEENKEDTLSDLEQYKLILLALQKKHCYAPDLQSLQQKFLSRFTERITEAANLAARDAQEALDIYLETMEAEQVRVFFPSVPTASTTRKRIKRYPMRRQISADCA